LNADPAAATSTAPTVLEMTQTFLNRLMARSSSKLIAGLSTASGYATIDEPWREMHTVTLI
jgi:hypothetical protein